MSILNLIFSKLFLFFCKKILIFLNNYSIIALQGGSIMRYESCAIRLKKALLIRGMKQVDLCALTGIPKSAVSQYLKGSFEPKQNRLHKIAIALNVSEAWLMGLDVPMERDFNINESANNILPLPKLKKLPRLGTIACGEPILAEENIEEYDSVPENINCDFTLKCKGNSMIGARIYDGDIVYIRQQSYVDNGEIAAVIIGNEATLKRVYKYQNKIVLQPENPEYEPLVFINEEMNQVQIIGKAVCFTSMIR